MKRVFVITIASSMFGILYSVVLSEGLSFGLVNGILNGIFIGLLDTIWVRKRRGRRLRQLPLIHYTLVLTVIWITIILFNMTLTRHWLGLSHDLSLQWMRGEAFGRHFVFSLFMAFTFNLLLRITSFLGTRSLMEILLGRYQEPAEQHLAFMFLDVVGSTRLTEKIGDVKTHQLIGNLFFDLAGVVDQYGGEVHRYIGDEMVVTWDLSKRRSMPDILGCLEDVFRIVEVQRQASVPVYSAWVDLRAGLNSGLVLVSEVGDLKRELVYFGDTINVAAGLQGHCKEAGVRALISSSLYQTLEHAPKLHASRLGLVSMKGKIEQVDSIALAYCETETTDQDGVTEYTT
ncbi:MAG: adenylate/guanylate cyclase domain-containing protein [Motiliproteus sp.]